MNFSFLMSMHVLLYLLCKSYVLISSLFLHIGSSNKGSWTHHDKDKATSAGALNNQMWLVPVESLTLPTANQSSRGALTSVLRRAIGLSEFKL